MLCTVWYGMHILLIIVVVLVPQPHTIGAPHLLCSQLLGNHRGCRVHTLRSINWQVVLSMTACLMYGISLCRGNNEEFLGRVSKYAERKKWVHLLQAFKAALGKVDKAVAGSTPAVASKAAAAAAAAAASKAPAPVPGETSAAVGVEGKAGKKGKEAKASKLLAAGKGSIAAATAPETSAMATSSAAAAGSEKAPKRQKTKKDASPASSAPEQAGEASAPATTAKASTSNSSSHNLTEALYSEWRHFAASVAAAERAAAVAEGGFAFAFVEGKLIQAVREGQWLLLDEINLAPAEVLERIAGLLEGPEGSITLLERGDTQQVLGIRACHAALPVRHNAGCVVC